MNCAKASLNDKSKRRLRRQAQGFTLLELMVVVLIMGLLLTMATMSVSTSTDRSLETEAKRFATLIKLASDEAIMNVRPMVVQINAKAYQFSLAGEVESKDPIFRPREIADHMQISVTIENEKIDFERIDEGEFANIYILPSGEMTPFQVIFSQDDGLAYETVGSFMGKVEFLGKVKGSD